MATGRKMGRDILIVRKTFAPETESSLLLVGEKKVELENRGWIVYISRENLFEYRRTGIKTLRLCRRDLNQRRQLVEICRERGNLAMVLARENCDTQIVHNGYCRVAEKNEKTKLPSTLRIPPSK